MVADDVLLGRAQRLPRSATRTRTRTPSSSTTAARRARRPAAARRQVRRRPLAPPPPPPGDTTPPDTQHHAGPVQLDDEHERASCSFEAGRDRRDLRVPPRQPARSPTSQACTSPKTYTGLGIGSHLFEVRAVDAAGNKDQSPALHTWTVTSQANDTTPPETTIAEKPPATHRHGPRRSGSRRTRPTRPSSASSTAPTSRACTRPRTSSASATASTPSRCARRTRRATSTQSPASLRLDGRGSELRQRSRRVGANADAWVEQGAPNNNKGGDSTLKVTSKSGNNDPRAPQVQHPGARRAASSTRRCCGCTRAATRTAARSRSARRRRRGAKAGSPGRTSPATVGTAAPTASGNGAGWREWNVAAHGGGA